MTRTSRARVSANRGHFALVSESYTKLPSGNMAISADRFVLAALIALVATSAVHADEDDECLTKKGETGVCTGVRQCKAAENIPLRQVRTMFNRCGFSGFEEVICCPPVATESRGPVVRRAERECSILANTTSSVAVALFIINGEIAELGEFPHMAALGYEKQGAISFDCGGTLISNRYVLTAAHCIRTLDRIEPTVVRLGVVDMTQALPENDYTIENITVHPDYKRAFKYDDIALIRLSQPITSYTNEIRPACLHVNSDDPPLSQRLYVTGWGATETNLSTQRSEVLLKANLTVVPLRECNTTYLAEPTRRLNRGIEGKQVCAGDLNGTNRKDTCQGDSGGPLQYHDPVKDIHRLFGITSFGKACGTAAPGVYTRVSSYLDWIESIVWPNP